MATRFGGLQTGVPRVDGEGTLKPLLFWLALALAVLPPHLVAQENGSPKPAPRAGAEPIDETTLLFDTPADAGDEGDFTAAPTLGIGDFVRMVLVLGLVVAAIYAVFFVLKKASAGSPTDSDLIRPLGSRTLPGNKSLHLVEIGNQIFLIGAADHAVNLIAEISDKETIDRLVLEAAAQRVERKKSFSQLLAGVLSGGRSPAEGGGGVESAAPANPAQAFQFMHRQKERLKRLRSG